MKKTLFLLSALLCLFACGNKDTATGGQVPPLDLTGFQVRDIPGTGLKKAERYNDEGRVMEEGILRNGKRNGTWIVYHETKDVPGKVASFVDDALHGPYLEYNKHGQLELMCSYSHNVLDGQFVRYASSRKVESGYYRNGQLHGIYRKYHEKRDAVQQEAAYKDGKMHGKIRFFNDAGDLLMEYDYAEGEKISGGIVER